MTEFTINLDDPRGFVVSLRDLLGGDAAVAIADQIEAQLPKPVPEEPTEWGSLVLAGCIDFPERLRWQLDADSFWQCERAGYAARWSQLRVPEVLRVGVGSAPVSEDNRLREFMQTPSVLDKQEPQPVEELVGILSPDGPWIPAYKVREVAAKMRGDASTGWASGTLGRDLWEAAARKVEALLPKEGQ